MAKLAGERVAWFSAGVIAPLFSPITGILKFTASLIAIIACLISLRLTILFTHGGK